MNFLRKHSNHRTMQVVNKVFQNYIRTNLVEKISIIIIIVVCSISFSSVSIYAKSLLGSLDQNYTEEISEKFKTYINSENLDMEGCKANGSVTLHTHDGNTYVGTLDYSIVENELVFTYSAAQDVIFSQAHLWLGTNISDMPVDVNGAPQYSEFPYRRSYSNATTLSYSVPISDIEINSDDRIFIFAHALVSSRENIGLLSDENAYAGDEAGAMNGYIELSELNNCERLLMNKENGSKRLLGESSSDL